MSEAALAIDLIAACVQTLGVAVLPIWGVDESGVCVCPKGAACNSPGKHPNWKLVPNGVKNATRDLAILRQWARQYPNGNWAIRCGEPLVDGGFLGVFDWDPRNGAYESLAELEAKGCTLPDTVTAASGGGGGHRLYRFPVAPAARSCGPGLDLQGGGKYIVITPSRHASGGIYTWDLGCAPGEISVATAPAWLVEGTSEAMPRPGRDSDGTARETVLGEAFALAGRAGAIMSDGSMFVNCVQSDKHTDGRGRGQDASTIILPPAGGSRFGGYKCQHGHCANLKWQDVVGMLPKEAYEAAQKKYPRLGVVPPQAEPVPVVAGEIDDGLDLTAVKRMLNYKSSKNGFKLVSDVVNLATILRYDPRWKGILQYDEFSQTLRTTRVPPWHEDDAKEARPGPWQDADTTRLDMWLRRTWLLELSQDKILPIVYLVGKREACNPLQSYLGGLQWDGAARLDKWLVDYLGCTDTPYVRSAGRKWLLSAVARAFDPGCKVDTLLVLEGPQGKGKSTALRTLMPDVSWFSDTPIPIGEKDSYVALRGKWIMELAELASLKKADLDRTKAFFSSPVDSYRPPYGREMVSVPRTCIFAGTVNLGQYLNDSTGGRRFIPVVVGCIDLDGIARDRDQLWAEAASIYLAWKGRGSPASECLWWPSPEELALYEFEQAERETDNPWEGAVHAWLQSERAAHIIRKHGFMSLHDIAEGALNIPVRDLDSSRATAIGIILTRKLGWKKKRESHGGLRGYYYYPPI